MYYECPHVHKINLSMHQSQQKLPNNEPINIVQILPLTILTALAH